MAASSKLIAEYARTHPSNLPLHSLLVESLSPMKRIILDYIRAHPAGEVTSLEIQQAVLPNCSLNSLGNELKALREYGLIKPIRSRHPIYWTPA